MTITLPRRRNNTNWRILIISKNPRAIHSRGDKEHR